MVGLGAANVTTLAAVEMAPAATTESARVTASRVMIRVIVGTAVKLGIDWRVGAAVSGDTAAAVDTVFGGVATADSAESAAAIGPGVTATRVAGSVALVAAAAGADGDRSLGTVVTRLRLPDAVDDLCRSGLSRPGVLDASTLADVAAALDAVALAACLLVEELFEAGDECAGLLVAALPADDDESEEDESEEPASAAATPQLVASATPTPRKTASPPTRPTSPEAFII